MVVTNVNPEYDGRTVSAGFRAQRESQTTTGRLNRTDRPENDPYRAELVYGQPAQEGEYDQGPWVAARKRSQKKVIHKQDAAYKAGKAFARVRVSAINAWVGGWAIFWYLSFQLPFALISTMGLGMASAVYSYFYTNNIDGEITIGDRILETVGDFALGAVAIINSIASYLFGINFDPTFIFIAPFALLFILGVFQLILTWFIYSLAGVKSLSGERAGVKNTMFLIAGIGMVIPVLNIFPLIFLWMLTVWRYPK